MRFLKLFTFLALFSTIGFSSLLAQEIDQERMQRDINIMENILQEMFKTNWAGDGKTIRVSSGSFSFGDNKEVNGTYVDDYGIIFTIPARSYGYIINTDGEEQVIHFQYSDDKKRKNVTKETIIARAMEFLMDYGSTIGQLENNSQITILYNSNTSGYNLIRVFSDEAKKKEQNQLPSIRVTAQVSNINSYRKGQIGETEFENRLSITTLEESGDRYHDLKIMANILKTTFEDIESYAFKIRGSVNHLYLDDLGAMFFVEASYGSNLRGLALMVDRIKNKLVEEAILNPDSTNTMASQNAAKAKEKQIAEKLENSYQEFKTLLKETIIDYGRTLKSVQSEESAIITVSLSQTGGDLPDRLQLQIKKSVLETYDKGNISRERAMEQITVREY